MCLYTLVPAAIKQTMQKFEKFPVQMVWRQIFHMKNVQLKDNDEIMPYLISLGEEIKASKPCEQYWEKNIVVDFLVSSSVSFIDSLRVFSA